MKTQITRHLAIALAGASLAVAADRVVPSDSGMGNSGVIVTGNAVNENGTLAGPDSTLKRGDQRFFEKLTRLNEREVALSRLAAERATTPQVRSFANEMVREHTQAGQEFGSLATRKGARLATVSTSDDPRGADKVNKIEKDWADKKGRDYDEAYLKAIIDAHEDTIDVLQSGADSKDPEIAAAAQKMLPKVKAHLERAEQLHKAID